jgi:hypothetical protein
MIGIDQKGQLLPRRLPWTTKLPLIVRRPICETAGGTIEGLCGAPLGALEASVYPACFLSCGNARSQGFRPVIPIRVLVPFPPDIGARRKCHRSVVDVFFCRSLSHTASESSRTGAPEVVVPVDEDAAPSTPAEILTTTARFPGCPGRYAFRPNSGGVTAVIAATQSTNDGLATYLVLPPQ